MRKILMSGLLACAALSCPAYVWLNTEYDFGTWKEAEGLRPGNALLVNDADTSIFIRRVRPSCGCTGVKWTETEILPGDTALVEFTYNPAGRPGPFEKTIKVYVGPSTEPDIIRIKGTVIGAPQSLNLRYPVSVGDALLSERVLDMKTLDYGKTRHLFITGYNASTDTIYPRILDDKRGTLPVTVSLTPTAVAPGDIFSIGCYLNTATTDIYGHDSAERTLCVGDSCVSILVNAFINPPSADLSAEQLAQAPQAVVPSVMELEGLRATKRHKIEFAIENPGRSELLIRRIYTADPRVKILRFPSRLGAGKRATVTAEYVPGAEAAPGDVLSDMFDIITNDPVRPIQHIRYAGRLE